MNLLTDSNNKKPEKTGAQKIVLSLLIISIVMLFLMIGLLMLSNVKKKDKTETQFKVNSKNVATSEKLIVEGSNHEKYIELKELAHLLEYNYYNGAYLEFSEDKSKGYIDNGYEIIGFEANSDQVYKVKVGKNVNYQHFTLSSEITIYNDNLYININDLPVALNVIIINNNINTPKYIAETYKKSAEAKGYDIDTSDINLKAIAYNMIIASKGATKGVLNEKMEEIIGMKYDTIEFNEEDREFVVSSNGKYGIVKTNGQIKIHLMYDSIEIVNYPPKLYIVKLNKKIGILDKEGRIIASPRYDRIGYPENKQQNIKDTIIIPSFNNEVGDSIVVSENQKYGLVELDTRKQIFECNLNGIYEVKENGNSKYIVEVDNQKFDINQYYNYIIR